MEPEYFLNSLATKFAMLLLYFKFNLFKRVQHLNSQGYGVGESLHRYTESKTFYVNWQEKALVLNFRLNIVFIKKQVKSNKLKNDHLEDCN